MILLRSVATHDALSAVLEFGVRHRQVPVHVSEGHRLSDVLRLNRSMFGVAGLATPPLDLLVHMQVMQILLFVAEVSQSGGFGVESDITVVATKAQGVVFLRVRHIELRGEVLAEDTEVGAAVRIMTRVAVAVLNRSVFDLIVSQVLGHFAMARQAEFCLWPKKEGGTLRSVYIVALFALAGSHGFMLVRKVQVFADIRMAAEAESGRVRGQLKLSHIRMRTVTGNTPVTYRLMSVTSIRNVLLLLMARKTQLLGW